MSQPSNPHRASSTSNSDQPRNPELDALSSRRKEQTAKFVDALKLCCEQTGFRRAKETSAWIAVSSALLATALVWWFWKWYFALLAGVGVIVVVALLFSGSDQKKAEITARAFFREMLRRPPPDPAFFWAVMTQWVPRVDADPQLKAVLAGELTRQVAQHRSPAYEDHLERLEALDTCESAQAAPAEAQAVSRKKQEREQEVQAYRAKVAAERQAKLLAVQAIAPGACLPVGSMSIVLKPSFMTNFSLAWEFSVSKEVFLILTGEGSVFRFPMDCIKQVDIESATDGFSTEALANKIVNSLFGDHSKRVVVELHVWLHWMSSSPGAGAQSYNTVTWEISDGDWAEVGDAWTRFSHQRFSSAPTCPVCGQATVVAKGAGVAAQMGFSKPRMLANCTACAAHLEFDLKEGRFQSFQPVQD